MLHERNQEEKDETEVNEEINNLIGVLLATRKIACDNLLSANNHLYMIGRCAPVAAWLGLQIENMNYKAMHDLAEQYQKVEKSLRRYEEENEKFLGEPAGIKDFPFLKRRQCVTQRVGGKKADADSEIIEIGTLHFLCCTVEDLLENIKTRAREINADVIIGKKARIKYDD